MGKYPQTVQMWKRCTTMRSEKWANLYLQLFIFLTLNFMTERYEISPSRRKKSQYSFELTNWRIDYLHVLKNISAYFVSWSIVSPRILSSKNDCFAYDFNFDICFLLFLSSFYYEVNLYILHHYLEDFSAWFHVIFKDCWCDIIFLVSLKW